MFQVIKSEMLVSPIASIIICLTFSAFPPLDVIVTLVILLLSANEYAVMLYTLSGIVMLVRLVQLQNASYPMLVTLSGIVTLVRPLQPENALSPMLVTVFPISA